MHKYDEFTHKEIAPLLGPGEGIELTGFLFTQSIKSVIISNGLSLIGDGYFFAALTRRHLFLIATEMGLTSLKTVNKHTAQIPLKDIKSIKPSGFLNQKMIAFEFNDGKKAVFRLNTLATHYAAGQKQFIEQLVQFHQTANS
jgi:hypothetical protein